jgi:sigma-E factor negative regulatory protein RseB
MIRSLALAAFLGSVAFSAAAETPNEALSWLDRIVSAAQRLNYVGTFTYQSEFHSETSRITHYFDGRTEREKLEVLDGSPREVVRVDDEVKCFLPADRTVIVQRLGQRAFPALPGEGHSGLTRHYRIRAGEIGRVAGMEAQLLVLEPRDTLRYGHLLWADRTTGLLLKLRTVDSRGGGIEQFAFTEVRIGGTIERDALKPRFDVGASGWTVYDVNATRATEDEDAWEFRSLPAGFARTAGLKRQFKAGMPEAMHYVFTDGMAAISVFIERVGQSGERPKSGFYRTGAAIAYQRVVGDRLITTIGEVPPSTLKIVAEGIQPRNR